MSITTFLVSPNLLSHFFIPLYVLFNIISPHQIQTNIDILKK